MSGRGWLFDREQEALRSELRSEALAGEGGARCERCVARAAQDAKDAVEVDRISRECLPEARKELARQLAVEQERDELRAEVERLRDHANLQAGCVRKISGQRDALANALLLYRCTVRMLPPDLIPHELRNRFVEAEEDAASALRLAGRVP